MTRRLLENVSRYVALTLLPVFAASCATHVSPPDPFPLQRGDLLFQDIDCGPLCDAIERVTQGINGAHFSHIGMVARVDGESVTIIEAVSAGVVETPLRTFLARSADSDGHPKVLVGRLVPEKQPLIDDALASAATYLGRPYDSIYAMTDDALYCSELVYDAFQAANGGAPIFNLYPMTFRDPDNGETFPPWADYYRDLGVAIPEGEPGLNPGGISRSPYIRIVHAYGRPEGWYGAVK